MSKIKILDSDLILQDTIDDVLTASQVERINSDNFLNFSTVLTSENTHLFVDGNVAEENNDYYDIVYYQKGQLQNGELVANVECEHVSYRLNEPEYDVEFFTEIGTPTHILTKILEGTGFTVGTVEFSDTITYSLQEKMSRRLVLMDFVAYLGGEVHFNKFQVSILLQRGSTTPKDLLKDRSVDVIDKVYNKRERDKNGNPVVSYTCTLIRPIDISLGDIVTMEYPTLDIDVELRVVSLTRDPYNKYNTTFEIGNFRSGLEDEARRIETSTIKKGRKYYGARISPEHGFESIRNDKMARGVFNADLLAFQSGDGTGDNWEDNLYYDAVLNKFVFNGELSANLIEALNAIITPSLKAEKGDIAELTVDQLDTSDKVRNYLNSSTADVNYIRIYDQIIEFITASTDGTLEEQLRTRDGNLLYWADDTHKVAVEEETEYPVMIYEYEELVKLQLKFVNEAGNYNPKFIIGAGTGVGDNGRGYMFKDTDSFNTGYVTTDGIDRVIKFTETGVRVTNDDMVYNGIRNITLSTSDPDPEQMNPGDIWFKYE